MLSPDLWQADGYFVAPVMTKPCSVDGGFLVWMT